MLGRWSNPLFRYWMYIELIMLDRENYTQQNH
jgi:hypothetical protein